MVDRGGACEPRGQHLGGRALEGGPAGQALEEHEAERIDVGGGRHLLPGGLFGAQVDRGPDEAAGGRRTRTVERVRDPEVEEPRLRGIGFPGDDQVRRLDVAMHDPRAVGGGESARGGGADQTGLGDGHRPAGEPLRESLTVDVLEHEVGRGRVEAGVEEGHDRRMPQPGERARLAAPPVVVAQRALRAVHLDRDRATQLEVVRAEHARRAAVAEALPQRVALVEDLTDVGAVHVLIVADLAPGGGVLQSAPRPARAPAVR